jgi:hypothetical protein
VESMSILDAGARNVAHGVIVDHDVAALVTSFGAPFDPQVPARRHRRSGHALGLRPDLKIGWLPVNLAPKLTMYWSTPLTGCCRIPDERHQQSGSSCHLTFSRIGRKPYARTILEQLLINNCPSCLTVEERL